jgi:hypothetical protein
MNSSAISVPCLRKAYWDLDDAGRPGPDARTVEVPARASFGEVVVRRSSATHTLRKEA